MSTLKNSNRVGIRTCSDYSPFGVELDGRTVSVNGYRYGFNGKEKTNEIHGGGNSFDFGARMLDPRVGKWLTIDPLSRKYPEISPYNYVGNSPILFVDPNGEEIIIHYVDENGQSKSFHYTPGIKPTEENVFLQQVHEAISYVMKNDDERVFQTISRDNSIVNIVQSFSFDHNADKTDYSTFQYNSSTGLIDESTVNSTISWNPTAMLITTNGGGIAPSSALLHEADHARGYLKLRTISEYRVWMSQQQPISSSSPDAPYHKPEEKRVIRGVESKYIRKVNSNTHDNWEKLKTRTYFNQETEKNVRHSWWRVTHAQQQTERFDHNGNVVESTGVNSITRKDGAYVIGQKYIDGKSIRAEIKK